MKSNTELREYLLKLAERMDAQAVTPPSVEAGWLLEAVDVIGEQQREIARLAEVNMTSVIRDAPKYVVTGADRVGIFTWSAYCSCGWLGLATATKRGSLMVAAQHASDHQLAGERLRESADSQTGEKP